ncbi:MULTISPECIES: glycosyltransferase family 2 protein [Glycomyces]|uniref:DUF2064 domain-containing protein n=2 Tax=Glycomyces TaxID=58113 RepID=A0A9X3SYB0_9ACTN|nr:DUF2064 domain-containing protein [Glycomyces lechevalierae]MDA1387872.1 DUF2064 domain-containing protein [Glycomyces lechevalierae]MDR7336540.1 glycosyltransferase A (GT-A) superfamily protein (DUF2064 family)/molybdopterin-guanine dinucleotide biosynthesis protein A [Glycomyces lechevalierae]
MRTHLLVVAKAPFPGRSKTRLSPPLTDVEAAAVAEAALADTLAAVAACGADRLVLALEGEPGPWLPPGFEVVPQVEGGFNERLAAAWSHLDGPGLQIGMDTPQVTPGLLDAALAVVADGADAALGLAEDGGWWALGLRRPHPGAFDGVPMSHVDTGARQHERLRALGLAVADLPVLRDLDDAEDAKAIAALVPGSQTASQVDALFGKAVRVDVILPVLNERDAIPWVLERMPEGYRPIVVDNGSDDGSAQVAAELGAEVVAESRRGFGAACYAGLAAATAPVVAFMDCDASLDPGDLPAVCAPVLDGDADLVLGARDAAAGAQPLHGRIANRYLAGRVRRYCGADVSDIGPMRAARREDLLGLGIADRRSGWPLEMVLRAGQSGWRITELPVPYRARVGKSKVTGTLGGTLKAVKDMRAQLALARAAARTTRSGQ